MEPLVSIIMPARNASAYIGEAINSILAQTEPRFELLIVDDGSDDQTQAIVKGFEDDRIQLFVNAENIGAGPSRDIAIDHASGDWLAFIDADDVWVQDRLEKFLVVSERSGDAFLFDNMMECHDTDTGLVHWKPVHGKTAFSGASDAPRQVSIGDLVHSSRLVFQPLFPRKAVTELSLRHSGRSYAEDLEFFFKLLSGSSMAVWFLPETTYLYRITPGSATSSRSRTSMMREVLESGREMFTGIEEIQQGFDFRIGKARYHEQYMQFLWAIKDRNLIDAIARLVRNPGFAVEFIRRFATSVSYYRHRKRFGGSARQVTGQSS